MKKYYEVTVDSYPLTYRYIIGVSDKEEERDAWKASKAKQKAAKQFNADTGKQIKTHYMRVTEI